MRFMVLGADGMAGSGVCHALRKNNVVAGTTRAQCAVDDIASFQRAIDGFFPDVIVNCIGAIPQRISDKAEMIACNALFPHQLRKVWKGKLIHISTDCVFDETVYGRSKMLGEVGMTLRCCVVGFSPNTRVSFLDWFVFASPVAVDGWTNAHFSPITNLELGRAVESAARNYAEGVFNAAGERMSKYEYLRLVNAEFDLNKTIRPVDAPEIDRSNASGVFTQQTGWEPRPTVAQIRELRE
jgi:dTDP-4-dehydrorhamnose reductase